MQCEKVQPIYEIIILKEEPKQETLVEKMIPLQLKYNLDNMKQEAIEEVAEKYLQEWRLVNNIHLSNPIHSERCKNDFKAGAKWQQEQEKNNYSEEEVFNLLNNFNKDTLKLRSLKLGNSFNVKEWFEQFKNQNNEI